MILLALLLFAVSFGAGYYRGLTTGTARWRKEMLQIVGECEQITDISEQVKATRNPHG